MKERGRGRQGEPVLGLNGMGEGEEEKEEVEAPWMKVLSVVHGKRYGP